MPSLPPPIWADLFYSGSWNDVSGDVRATQTLTVTRGLSSESSSAAEPTQTECILDSRGYKYAPRAPQSDLYGLIGRNTGFRWGYTAGSPWAVMAGGFPGTDALETPDAAALDVTGDFDLRIEVALEDWSESQMLCTRYTPGANEMWALEMVDGFPTLLWSPDGTFASRIDKAATQELKAHNGQRLAVRVHLARNNGTGVYELRFYTGRTVDDEEWHLLGDPIVGGSTTAVFAGTAPLEIGYGSNFNLLPSGGLLFALRGKVYALKLLDGSTTKVDMSTGAATAGGTSFVDATGLTWTKQSNTLFTNKHIRMAGEVPAWPPTRDLSGNDNYVSISPAGITRRMDAGNKPADSVLLRYIKSLSPVTCWPLTDGQETSEGRPLFGRQAMTVSLPLDLGTDLPEWGSGTLADWLEPVITFKGETAGYITGGVANSTSAAAAWSVDFLYRNEASGNVGVFEIRDRGIGDDDDPQVYFQMSMDAQDDDITVFRVSKGDTSSSSALILTGVGAGIYDGQMHHIRFSVDPGATNSTWEMFVDGASVGSGTLTGIVVKAVRYVRYNWSLVSAGGITGGNQELGYVTYWDGTGPTAAEFWDAATGFQGEKAGDRIARLCTEAGYTATVAGESVFQQRMGIQGRKTLLALLNEASATNFGYLPDARDRVEVIHRGQSTLWNQPPALTLDFTAGLISAPFKPVDDDKLTENDVSVKREFGSLPGRQVLEEGELSVQDPENGGVGRYDKAYTYSLYTDDQADQVAHMRVHLGTYNGVRYTRITLNLANDRVYALIDDILRVDVGDKLRLTNVPEDHGPDDVDVLVNGYTEEVGPDGWLITFNCVPGEPWTAAIVDVSLADTAGSELAEALDASETGVDVLTTGLARWVNAAPALNSNSRFDSGISGWSAFGGASIAWDPVRGHDSPGCIAVTTGGAASPRTEGARVAVSPNKQYVISGWLFCDVGLGVAANVSVNWYTAFAGGSFISTSNATLAVLPTGGWRWVQATVTAPATANGAGVLTALTGTPSAGLVWRGDELQLREYVPDTYTDSMPFDVRTGGEVMRVTAATPAVWDTFTRSITDGWGAANIGGSWTNTGGAAADYDVTGSAGTHSLTSVNVNRHSVIPAPSADVDLTVDIATSVLAAGGSQYVGLLARHADVNNHYYARATFQTSNAIQLVLQRKVAGSQTDMATVTVPDTHVAGTFYRLRFQVIGSALRAKLWDAAGPEPVAWQATATNTALTAAGSVGVRSILDSANSNTLPVTVSYDNFGVLGPQTFTVIRSVNGVQKSHAAGQPISLANPVYVAM
ncbi:hypothetical protein AB0L99_42550 [Streptomyces sp. NPDC051954]|uniref:hypothetical protein n=1 Tax=Streptomyces sp. NPDC051954 TaxID=3155524 RepID=UPI0034250D5D